VRRCACPKREPMAGMPSTAKYRYPEICRKRAYREKLKREAEAVGLSVAPTLAAVRAAVTTNGRDGDAYTPAKRPQRRRTELRVSYRKAVEAIDAGRPLSSVLSPKQRQVLEQQRQEAA